MSAPLTHELTLSAEKNYSNIMTNNVGKNVGLCGAALSKHDSYA